MGPSPSPVSETSQPGCNLSSSKNRSLLHKMHVESPSHDL